MKGFAYVLFFIDAFLWGPDFVTIDRLSKFRMPVEEEGKITDVVVPPIHKEALTRTQQELPCEISLHRPTLATPLVTH